MKEISASPGPIHSEANVLWGLIFILFGFISFLGFFCTAILSKLLPASENQFISAIQSDRCCWLQFLCLCLNDLCEYDQRSVFSRSILKDGGHVKSLPRLWFLGGWWLIGLKKVLSIDNLQKRAIIIPNICPTH
ncbi:uncharacterized protein LOC131251215 isoform X4 [Magnolia sinica]|uniref:uncharacterized protein LOC131251215 isoform X4 n=1 Tax=Magnolia sinica TaxID=86752 RepID=UPI00265AD6AA|nr:uncharacterized protein LOC131251215 isoform X4 [Magnolia sinica]